MPISSWIRSFLVIMAALIFLGRLPAQESDSPKDQKKEVENLLEDLRRLQDPQVAVEVRFLTINDTFFERIGLDFDFHANLPSSGLFQEFLNPGFGTRVGGAIPLLGGDTPFDGLWRATGRMGFLFNDWDGSKEVQINTPTNNFLVSGAQAYRGEVGLGLEALTPLGGARPDFESLRLLTAIEVSGNLGGLHADIDPHPFTPALPMEALPGSPRSESLLGGWNLRLGLGLLVGNSWQFKVHGGYGDSWTSGILNRTAHSGTFEAGASLQIMLVPFLRQP